jgi:cobyrinic acid a,c-diamide synthase
MSAPPGLMIAAPRSGSGKTTLTLGLLRAFRRAGVTVGSAKCGPDYIDGNFHRAASGHASINLDSWAMPPALMTALASEVAIGCDLVICEALMGLFDGVPGETGRSGSSADVAAALGWPVLLVLDASGQSQSAAAVAKGCATYDSRIKIAGVVLNRIGSPRHARLATDAIEALGIPVVGAMPRSEDVALPERHLGLVQAGETGDLERRLDEMADFVEAHTRIDAIRSLAAVGDTEQSQAGEGAVRPPGQRVAVAQDAAFSFIYPHVLQGWRRRGAEIRFFSPLADEAPHVDCDACWLPGGYPELHAGRIAGSRRFLRGLGHFAGSRPVHGECGGYMVLGKSLTDVDGITHEMAGLLDVSTSFAKRKLHLGYRNAMLIEPGCLGDAGARLRGHEFHYATIEDMGPDAPLALVSDAYGSEPTPTGSRRGLVSGSFFHVIAAAP